MRLVNAPLDAIRVDDQVRRVFDENAIRRLADSIAQDGLQHPVLCRREDGQLVLIDGERRLRASALLGRTEIQAIVIDDALDAVAVLARQLVCNLQREDLDPIERAEGVRALMERAGISAEQAARRIGQSPASVSRWLALLKLPEELRAMVTAGTVSADAAYALSRIDDPHEQARRAQQAAAGTLTRDQLACAVRAKRPREQAPASRRSLLPIGPKQSVTLHGPGLTLEVVIAALEGLLTRMRKARTQGLTLGTFARALRDQTASA